MSTPTTQNKHEKPSSGGLENADPQRLEVQKIFREMQLVTMRMGKNQRRRIFVASLGSPPRLSSLQSPFANTWVIIPKKKSKPLHIGEGFCIKVKTSINSVKQWIAVESVKGDHGGIQWLVEKCVDPAVTYMSESHLVAAINEIPSHESALGMNLNCTLCTFAERKQCRGQFLNSGHLLRDVEENQLIFILQTTRFKVQSVEISLCERITDCLKRSRTLRESLGLSMSTFTFEKGSANGKYILDLADTDYEWNISVSNPSSASESMNLGIAFTEDESDLHLRIFDSKCVSNGELDRRISSNNFVDDFCGCLRTIIRDKYCTGVSVPVANKSEILIHLAAHQSFVHFDDEVVRGRNCTRISFLSSPSSLCVSCTALYRLVDRDLTAAAEETCLSEQSFQAPIETVAKLRDSRHACKKLRRSLSRTKEQINAASNALQNAEP